MWRLKGRLITNRLTQSPELPRFLVLISALLLAPADSLPLETEHPDDGKNFGRLEVKAQAFEIRAIDIFDANPGLLPPNIAAAVLEANRSQYRDTTGLRKQPVIQAASALGKDLERFGAAADGVSRLLIRVKANQSARIRFLVRRGRIHGTVAPDAADTVEFNGEHYALALYTPPDAFLPSEMTLQRGTYGAVTGLSLPGAALNMEHRFGMLWIEWGTQADENTCRNIYLVRPPVVLVHGTYDNSRDCWDWPGNDPSKEAFATEGSAQYVTESFSRQLEADGFHVYIVNYKQSNGTDPEFNGQAPPSPQDPSAAGSAAAIAPENPAETRRRLDQAARRSWFKDNARVVWEGGRQDHRFKRPSSSY